MSVISVTRRGNLARVCRSQRSAGGDLRRGGAAAKAHHLTTANSEPEEEIPLFDLGKGHSAPITVDVELNGVPVSMELDTGAAVSVMSQQQQQVLFPQAQFQPSKVILRTYTAQSVGMAGTLPVHVVYGEQEQDPSLVIVQGNGPGLFGRDWLSNIGLKWPSIAYQKVGNLKLEEVLQQFEEVFWEELGIAQTPPVHLTV